MITRQSYQIAKPATSLRVRLTAIILVPLLIIALAVGIWQLDYTRQKAEGIFDRSLLSTGLAIAADVARSGGDALSLETRDLLNDTSGGQVYYHAFAPSGVYVTGYATPLPAHPRLLRPLATGFTAFTIPPISAARCARCACDRSIRSAAFQAPIPIPSGKSARCLTPWPAIWPGR